jgi:hypothetical protein
MGWLRVTGVAPDRLVWSLGPQRREVPMLQA